jgi:hypothetical protein
MEQKIVTEKKRRAAHSRSNIVSTAKTSSSGLYLEPKRVILWEQPKNPFGTLFSKSVLCMWAVKGISAVLYSSVHLPQGEEEQQQQRSQTGREERGRGETEEGKGPSTRHRDNLAPWKQ